MCVCVCELHHHTTTTTDSLYIRFPTYVPLPFLHSIQDLVEVMEVMVWR